MPLVDAEKELGWERKTSGHEQYWVVPPKNVGQALIAYSEDLLYLDKVPVEDIPRHLLGGELRFLLVGKRGILWNRDIEEEMIGPYLSKRLELGV